MYFFVAKIVCGYILCCWFKDEVSVQGSFELQQRDSFQVAYVLREVVEQPDSPAAESLLPCLLKNNYAGRSSDFPLKTGWSFFGLKFPKSLKFDPKMPKKGPSNEQFFHFFANPSKPFVYSLGPIFGTFGLILA